MSRNSRTGYCVALVENFFWTMITRKVSQSVSKSVRVCCVCGCRLNSDQIRRSSSSNRGITSNPKPTYDIQVASILSAVSTNAASVNDYFLKLVKQSVEAVTTIKTGVGNSENDKEEDPSADSIRLNQEKKAEALKAISEYVSGMVGDFFSSSQSSIKPTSPKKEEVPKFVILQRSHVGKADIDRITTRCLVNLSASLQSETLNESLMQLNYLNDHLARFPFAKGFATKLHAISKVKKAKNHPDTSVCLAAKEALARLGYVEALTSRGIRILCIDGGGMKGVIALEALRQIEHETGQLIHEVWNRFHESDGIRLIPIIH